MSGTTGQWKLIDHPTPDGVARDLTARSGVLTQLFSDGDARHRAACSTWISLLGCFHLLYGGFFPNEFGRVGHDFAYFLPVYLDGYVWSAKNGLLEVPWFTPSFCTALPFFADPQSGYYSLSATAAGGGFY